MSEIVGSAWKIIPQFQSRSIKATVKFYNEELSFITGGLHPDDDAPTFCSIFIGKKAAANIYFHKCSPEEFHPSKAMISLGTKELDEFHDHLRSRAKVEFAQPIKDEAWGYRQFTIKDIDGNELTFFKFLEGGNPGAD
ncbi:Uncharacterized protein BP5553_09552 [Venustampulla echinocandica]|uniref:VOC domain-containing protein n=1 Tax=Venustampulla echinocandica TaxID=2656787 RepID=A0A370TBC8_9HELO|nr:Uncharacterized protein BP5553_09552 [Venustampulla echinocandica]RDL31343.1 Uncharacterized protein BP5553_09552 [Venustampulla echinocandica]